MFTGDSSGDFLFARLFEAGFASQPTSTGRDDGLELRDAYISPAVRCAPPDNRPSPDEFRACRAFLHEELRLLTDLEVILPLGALAWKSVLSLLDESSYEIPSPAPSFFHGLEFVAEPTEPATGRKMAILGSYHVSRQNTNTGRLTAEMFKRVLGRARELLQGGFCGRN